jgi:hypothetical protein
MSDEFAVIYVDRKYGNAYYDRYRNNWIHCEVEHEQDRALKGMGMNDWHTNVLLELLRITREGYLSNISFAVEEVTGNKPISFQQFTKDYASDFR